MAAALVGGILLSLFQKKTVSSPTLTANISQPLEAVKKFKDVKTLIVRDRKIAVGDKFDDVVTIVRPEDMITQTITRDPKFKNNLFVVKTYEVDGKIFKLLLATLEET